MEALKEDMCNQMSPELKCGLRVNMGSRTRFDRLIEVSVSHENFFGAWGCAISSVRQVENLETQLARLTVILYSHGCIKAAHKWWLAIIAIVLFPNSASYMKLFTSFNANPDPNLRHGPLFWLGQTYEMNRYLFYSDSQFLSYDPEEWNQILGLQQTNWSNLRRVLSTLFPYELIPVVKELDKRLLQLQAIVRECCIYK